MQERSQARVEPGTLRLRGVHCNHLATRVIWRHLKTKRVKLEREEKP